MAQQLALTLKNGKKVNFTSFGKIRFGNAVKKVDDLTKKNQKAIKKMYEDAAKQVRIQINRLNFKEQTNPDGFTATDALNKLRLMDLENSLKENLQEITSTNQQMILGNMNSVTQAVTKDMTQWLNSVGINVKESYAQVPQTVIANIVSGELYGKQWKFSQSIWGDYNKSCSDITRIVANGIASGKSTYEIAKDLGKYVDPNAKKDFAWSKVYPGSKKVVDYNAQRLARTMINHAYQQAVVQVCKDNPFITGIEWRCAFTHTTCEVCEALHGQIFSPNDVPLDHPNGKCYFVAVLNKTQKQIADDLYTWWKGKGSDEFNAKMDKFAEQAGFTKDDIDLSKIKQAQSTPKAQ